LRSGAKIGSLQTNFQAFCSYLFHFGHNSLEGWEIIFQKAPPGANYRGRAQIKEAPGGGAGGRQLRQDKMAREDEAGRRRTAALMTGILCRLHAVGSAPLAPPC